MRQVVGGLAVGFIAAGVAVGLALLLDLLFGGWSWDRFALLFLMIGAFFILCLFTRPGVDPARGPVELIGREEAGTLLRYQPATGSIAGVFASFPPGTTFVVILYVYGF